MREGVIRIDIDEFRSAAPTFICGFRAAAVPMAMHLVPDKHWRHASEQAREAMPILHAIVKELRKYPDATSSKLRIMISTSAFARREGKLQIDVDAPDEKVHVLCPLSTIEDVTIQLEEHGPSA